MRRAAALLAVSVLTLAAACSEAPAPSPAPSPAPAGSEAAGANPSTEAAPPAEAAVGSQAPVAAAPAVPVGEGAGPVGPPVLNRVNLTSPLRLVGTEPFWGADLGEGRLVLEAPDREPVRLAVGQPVLRPGEATWRAAGATVRVTGAPCSDGMSDRTYPLTAVIQSGGVTWKGCAANAAAFRRAQGRESGEVR